MGEGIKKSKKWIIVLAVLVLIAIVVTLVVVFWPKNTQRVVDETNKQSETMFLKKEADQQLYTGFQGKIKAALNQNYADETDNVLGLIKSLNTIMEYYSMPIVFAQNNDVFQSNFNTIIRAYESARSSQSKMQKVLEDVSAKLTDAASNFIQGAWDDFRGYFIDYYSSLTTAIGGLDNIVASCVPQGVQVNAFTVLVLKNVDNYLLSIQEGLKDKDVTPKAISYKVDYLQKFLTYFSYPKSDILFNYNFDDTIKQNYQLIVSFENVYSTTFKTLIDSIDEAGFGYTASGVVDLKNTRSITETFLKGELSI